MPRNSASTRRANSMAATSASSRPTSPMPTTWHACCPPFVPNCRRWRGSSMRRGGLWPPPLFETDEPLIENVLAGKVWGAWHLSQAAPDMRLDFFVVTSSIAAVWGSRGQIVYASANAFLDGLAWWLRARGVPATSVNFGLWPTGMGGQETRDALEELG